MLQNPVPNRYQSDQVIEENYMTLLRVPPINAFRVENDSLATDDVQPERLQTTSPLGSLVLCKNCVMALLDILSSRLSTVTPLKCAGCINVAIKKMPWLTKSLQSRRESSLQQNQEIAFQ
jgi:hypothetical protein